MQIQLAIAAIVISAGFFLYLAPVEWCLVVVAIALVFVAEAFNTALEAICDLVSPELHPLVKRAKDIAAGAVLISALGAAIIGALLFGPRLWAVFF